jgi:sec-independent protein translocase protein TatC
LGISIGTVIGLMFSDQVVAILKAPLESASSGSSQEQDTQRLKGTSGWMSPDLAPWLEEERQSPETGGTSIRANSLPPFAKFNLIFFARVENQRLSVSPVQFSSRQGGGHLSGDWPPSSLPKKKTPATNRARPVEPPLSGCNRPSSASFLPRVNLIPEELEKLATTVSRLLSRKGVEPVARAPQMVFAPPSTASKLLLGSTDENPLLQMRTALDRNFDEDAEPKIDIGLRPAFVFPTELQPLKAELVPLQTWRRIDTKPQALSVLEPFMIWMKAGIITGIVLSSPYVFFQLWSFIAAGLYPHEKNHVYMSLPISLGLFFSGILLAISLSSTLFCSFSSLLMQGWGSHPRLG